MQPPGGVNQHHIRLPRLGCAGGVEHHGGGVCPLVLLDDLHSGPVGPDGQLLRSGGPEGIGRAEDDPLAFVLQLGTDFSDGRGLAHAVHPDKQGHGGLSRQVQPHLTHSQRLGNDVSHQLPGPFHCFDALLPGPAAQLLHQA